MRKKQKRLLKIDDLSVAVAFKGEEHYNQYQVVDKFLSPIYTALGTDSKVYIQNELLVQQTQEKAEKYFKETFISNSPSKVAVSTSGKNCIVLKYSPLMDDAPVVIHKVGPEEREEDFEWERIPTIESDSIHSRLESTETGDEIPRSEYGMVSDIFARVEKEDGERSYWHQEDPFVQNLEEKLEEQYAESCKVDWGKLIVSGSLATLFFAGGVFTGGKFLGK